MRSSSGTEYQPYYWVYALLGRYEAQLAQLKEKEEQLEISAAQQLEV